MSGGSLRSFGQEARHQQPALGRVHRGDAEREAHRRIGRRAAALAQDVARAGEADDVVHGQEERFVLELGDQRQLVFDLRDDFRRHAFGPALAHARLGAACAASVVGVWPSGHQFGRIVVVHVVHARTCSGAPVRTAASSNAGRHRRCDGCCPARAACAGGARRCGTGARRTSPAAGDGGSRSSCPAARAGGAWPCARRRWRAQSSAALPPTPAAARRRASSSCSRCSSTAR